VKGGCGCDGAGGGVSTRLSGLSNVAKDVNLTDKAHVQSTRISRRDESCTTPYMSHL
jgi:hypothetical protein